MTPAHYSFSWAAGVVNQLEKKYPRATAIVYEITGITSRNMAAFLATNDEVFPQLRELIHWHDNWIRSSPKHVFGKQDVRETAMICRRKGWERLADRLTAIQKTLD